MYHLLYRVINIFHAIPVQHSQRSWVQILYRPEFFSGLIFTTAQVVFLTAGRSLSYLRLYPQFKYMTFIFTSLSAVQIYDFHISTVVYSPLHRFIWNQHNYQLPVDLLVQLVERCTGIPYRPEFFLRPYFHYCSSSVP